MNITIETARPEDAQAVAALVQAAYHKYVARIGTRPGPMLDDYAAVIGEHIVHVARGKGRIVGIVVLIEKSDGILLDNVAVDPELSGQGIGGQLLDFAEAEAARRGYGRLDLYTHEMMTENVDLYLRRGYVETDRRTERGFPRVYMAKDLTGVRPS